MAPSVSSASSNARRQIATVAKSVRRRPTLRAPHAQLALPPWPPPPALATTAVDCPRRRRLPSLPSIALAAGHCLD
eukprot:CAMPEP_0185490786 /NCGR_PEP_ID=MMETSP1366-20130426/14207_1 /TAXON_ID=38817 /ORGANISM="Gephyrocapsa oceanica, Strain RCC1303" /LENGTH=75 /DNA_ID=CAMNT_0028099491 /DNA_START=150 /DNA_END=374 /DNA_ORIENTATION=-